jgi:ferredoxin-NADP reductase
MRVPAEICVIRQETPSVKSFLLGIGKTEFTFLPGQWLDCYIDAKGELGVAGYSITSSPTIEGEIELTVRESNENPVTRFLHEGAGVGDIIYLDGGHGDFHYSREMGDSLVLIAGGIGITPLMSILSYVDMGCSGVRATLIYSAKMPSEFVFRERLEEMARRNGDISCFFTITRSGEDPWEGLTGRVDASMLQEIGVDVEALYFICGPQNMGPDVRVMLIEMGVPPKNVRYEQWW